MKQRLRIAFITHFWDGIIQRPHHWIHEALANKQNEVHVFTLPSPVSHLAGNENRDHSENIQIHRLPRNLPVALLKRIGFSDKARLIQLDYFTHFIQSNVMDKEGADFDVIIYASYPWGNLVRRHGGVFVYDCMDQWTGFNNLPPEVDDWENKLVAQADCVLAISETMSTRLVKKVGSNKIELVPNGCNYDHFATAVKDTKKEQPIIGYTGAIHDWFDWDVIMAIAKAYPSAKIELVGPAHDTPPNLPPNVFLMGVKPYQQIPSYNARYDVGLIPFRDRALIKEVSPIKLYEYLAGGIPIVSTPMPDTIQYEAKGIVYLADSPEKFVEKVGEAINTTNDPELIKERQHIAKENSWASRWLQIENRLM